MRGLPWATLLAALASACDSRPQPLRSEPERQPPAGLTSANPVGHRLVLRAEAPRFRRGPLSHEAATSTEAREHAVVDLLTGGLDAPLATAPDEADSWLLRGVLQAHIEHLRACNPGFDAALLVEVTLGEAGRAERVTVSGSTRPESDRCLEKAILALKFPNGARSAKVTVVP